MHDDVSHQLHQIDLRVHHLINLIQYLNTPTGDCEMAICGGVSCIVSPETFIPLCRARMMSAVGQCQTFCDTADGYARGEGCGIVILKKMSQVF